MLNKKISILIFLFVIIVLTALQSSCLSKGKNNVHRFILITIDTLRADHLGCYGYPRSTSPFMDDLAKNGVLFLNAFSSSSHTSPSHTSIFTSLHPVQHNVLVNGASLHGRAFTMAEMFQDCGYGTAGFFGVGFLERITQGFDVTDFKKYKKLVHYRQAQHTIDSVLDWLSGKKTSDKFFLWIHLFDPHRPYHPPKEYLEKIDLKSQTEKDIFINYLYEVHKLPVDFYKHDFKLIQDYNNYDAEIMLVDNEIKRLFDYMDKKGLNADSLWVITADHGEGLGNHHYESHGMYIYNEQIHIPLIFYFGNRAYAHTQVDSLVRHVDILPTFGDLTGYSLDKKEKIIQGFSLMSLMEHDEQDFPVNYSFSQRRPWDDSRRKWEQGEIYCLQDLNFKYIYHSEGKDEFYDLRYDPFESRNLMDFPYEIRDRMKRGLVATYSLLASQNIEGLNGKKIDEKHLKELKALGYVR